MPEFVIPQRVLGSSGIRVSELCLGAMTFGTEWGFGADESTCRQIYDTYREAGGNIVDTANNYTDGASEEIVGRLIAPERDSIVLSTKFTLQTDPADPNSGGSHRKSLRRSVETSLRRLGTDYIDLLWVHAWDRSTAADETLRALDDLIRSGKVLALGVTNTPAWVISRSTAVAELRGWSAFCALQVEYSLAARDAERDILPMAQELGLAVCAWSPLARGLLTRDLADAQETELPERLRRARTALREVALELGTTPARAALSWVLHHRLMVSIGARTPEQLRDNLGAPAVSLDEEHLARLDAVSRVPLGYPYRFLEGLYERGSLPPPVPEPRRVVPRGRALSTVRAGE
ncbi:aldo/keto reductase [Rhodococcus sp. DMU1]|uniref:aldo/keto reductase n=1 Tax=Rhodococcus sp. DMU1 TaxID=2722825 RepID=UPI00143E5458|nr:aldo/keto reductase [Rhodococcus sp. DMU1]QIX52659.1 aldo/keto reductase [Rhodococcus sp. DMU1]